MLAASDRSQTIISSDDQLLKILDNIGSLDENDQSFISERKTLNYMRQLCNDRPVADICDRFRKFFDPELIKILENLLEVNPYYRRPISELIQSPLFDTIRVESLERPAESILSLNIDK